jgi:hypothetical protein
MPSDNRLEQNILDFLTDAPRKRLIIDFIIFKTRACAAGWCVFPLLP